MNMEFLQGLFGTLIRRAIMVWGAYIVQQGWITEGQLDTIVIGASLMLASLVWSLWSKSKGKISPRGFASVVLLSAAGLPFISGCATFELSREKLCENRPAIQFYLSQVCAESLWTAGDRPAWYVPADNDPVWLETQGRSDRAASAVSILIERSRK